MELHIGRKSGNSIKIENEITYVLTTKGEFLIDSEDIDKIKNYTWWIGKNGYVYTKIYFENKSKIIYLSRLIMDANGNEEIDHIDRNKLNNKKGNLRIADRVTNNANKSKVGLNYSSTYKGVLKVKGGWKARIGINNKEINIGTFTNEIAAANAYNFYAELYLGEYAFKNLCEVMDDWILHRRKYGNKTIFQGVTKREDKILPKPWQVYLNINGKRKCVGHFSTDLEAAKVYNEEALKLNYDLPKLNIINGRIYGLTDEILKSKYMYNY
jgi:hypothetical protein